MNSVFFSKIHLSEMLPMIRAIANNVKHSTNERKEIYGLASFVLTLLKNSAEIPR
jgi:hypothetical protein